jgi:hypothetical protein
MVKPWSFSMRQVLVKGSNRAPTEFSLVRQFGESFRAGAEFMPRADRWHPVWNYRILEATEAHPALAIGQSSAWPSSKTSGSAFTLTTAQGFGNGLSGYLSVSYAPDGDLWQVPGGINWRFHEHWSSRLMWDGGNLHPVVTYHQDVWSMSLLLLDGEDPTFSMSVGF